MRFVVYRRQKFVADSRLDPLHVIEIEVVVKVWTAVYLRFVSILLDHRLLYRGGEYLYGFFQMGFAYADWHHRKRLLHAIVKRSPTGGELYDGVSFPSTVAHRQNQRLVI